eukprot:3587526-Pleurochrysis_carterae.AAC.1
MTFGTSPRSSNREGRLRTRAKQLFRIESTSPCSNSAELVRLTSAVADTSPRGKTLTTYVKSHGSSTANDLRLTPCSLLPRRTATHVHFDVVLKLAPRHVHDSPTQHGSTAAKCSPVAAPTQEREQRLEPKLVMCRARPSARLPQFAAAKDEQTEVAKLAVANGNDGGAVGAGNEGGANGGGLGSGDITCEGGGGTGVGIAGRVNGGVGKLGDLTGGVDGDFSRK